MENQIIIVLPEWFYYWVIGIMIVHFGGNLICKFLDSRIKKIKAKTEDMKERWKIQKEM